MLLREAAKKVIFFSGPATKKGGVVGKGLATKKKEHFLKLYKNPPKKGGH